MLNCFYSPSEKRAFWIYGYCILGFNEDFDTIIELLTIQKSRFLQALGKPDAVVQTTQIFSSSCYKNHRVYYADNIETCPPDFKELSMKMHDFLAI